MTLMSRLVKLETTNCHIKCPTKERVPYEHVHLTSLYYKSFV